MKKIFVFIFIIFIFVSDSQLPRGRARFEEDEKIAIMVVGYNRPHYLQKVLQALIKNPEAHEIPIYFFFDGGRKSRQIENVKVAKSFSFPKMHFILRKKNIGCPKNIIDGRRLLFDHLGYEKVIVIEDDHVIAPNYIRFLFNLYNWSKQNLSDVGVVSGWNPCLLTEKEKEFHQKEVYLSHYNLWAYLIDRDCWDKIKNVYYEYESLFLENRKAHFTYEDQIRQWIKKKVEQSSKVYSPIADYKIEGGFHHLLAKWHPTGQDGIMYLGLWLADLSHLSTVVNRMVNIGQVGLNSYPEFWDRNFKDITLNVFEEDRDRIEFFLVK